MELLTEVLARHAHETPEKVYLLHEGQRVSYREVEERTNQVAHVFLQLGLGRGDRVTLAMGNSLAYVLAAFGTLKAGGVLHPLNPSLGRSELEYLLRHAEPRLVVVDPQSAAGVVELARRVAPQAVVASFVTADGLVGLSSLLAAAPTDPVPVRLGPDDASTLLYTSGTTGAPKGVLFRHRSTGAAGKHFLEALGIGRDDVLLAVTPLFHGNAWGGLVTALQAGASFAFPRQFSASQFWNLVGEVGATVLYTLGTILAILLQQPPSPAERKHKLRVILGLGSAPIRTQIIERFGVAHVVECFGSTDAGVVTIEPLGASPRAGSCGPPVPGVQVRIVDDLGQDLPPGQVGEIAVRSAHCLSEYFRDPEQTRQALRDGWFFTGDLGYVDADGWLYFVDRKRDVIRRGGENVSSLFVEKVLREHPAVAEVAVVGVPHPVLGQEIKAFVVARSPVTAEELERFAAERLAKFQVPRLWEFRESLPKTPTQRVEKYKLRQEAGSSGPLLG